MLLIGCLSARAAGQTEMPAAKQGLAEALELYNSGNYTEAFNRFFYLANLYPQDEHQTIFRFMAAKSLYAQGNLERANQEFVRFIADFPGSAYIADAYLYGGHIAYAKKRYKESAGFYIKANDLNPEAKAGMIADANLRLLLDKELNVSELISLADSFPQAKMADDVCYYLGKRQLEIKDYKAAMKTFETYFGKYANGKYITQAKQSYDFARNVISQKATIGVLAPLTGSYVDYGLEMVSGIKLVFDDQTNIDGRNVELLIKDTGEAPGRTALALRELATSDPVAIIGPLRSESAVAAAVAADCANIPLITPTASEKGITDLGKSIYQISPPSEKIAESLAEYAVSVLGVKKFGIIAPGDFTSRQVAHVFASKVYELGGEVIGMTFYESGQTDFSNQIKPLRDVLLMETEEQIATGLIDSLAYYDTTNQKWLDIKDWRVFLEGLFLPGDPDELAMLIPQIRYNVISTRFFGLYGWDSSKLIGRIGSYIQDAVFATDFFQGSGGPGWPAFYQEYRKKYNREPDRVAASAYDAATIIRDALRNGAFASDSIRSWLDNVQNYRGASCIINFKGTGRSNDAVSIYTIKENSFIKVK